MNKSQAVNILSKAISQMRLTLDEHKLLQQALALLSLPESVKTEPVKQEVSNGDISKD